MRRLWVLTCCLITACRTLGHNTHTHQTGEPAELPSVLATPVDFSGWRGENRNPELISEIRIGVFAPHDSAHPVSGPVFNAAHLAIDQVNASGGFEGRPFRLMSRWDDDPWRGGSKQMIKLVHEDSVWAVLGSIDGTTTHIAEQVVAKAWLSLISPVSADPTLTYIRIPWMFRLPPDDERQAELIMREGIRALHLESVGLVTSTDHDGRIFGQEMLARLTAERVPPAFHFEVSPSNTDFPEIVERMGPFEPDGIIVRLPPAALSEFLEQLEASASNVPVLLPWIPGVQPAELRERWCGDLLHVLPFSESDNPAYAAFARVYRDRYGTDPTASAAYTYDAIALLAHALRLSGLNRADLRDAIAGASGFRGVTGKISWDNAGGNQAEPVLRVLSGACPRYGSARTGT